ncbi:MAG: YebC/PmpR family DNA-binding regulatory protein [Verrucomicrobiales bacterium]|jgi:YebC/PmpR family DNA-binding regulatory protein
MAGHNKWSKVKHIKARVDAKKGKVFSRFSKEISIASRDGGGDPSMNPSLRTAIEGAKAASMPKENIERAIKKGTGELGGDAIEEITYEGFAAGGVALIIEICTDNRNRSAADINLIFNKKGGNMGQSGSVTYQFKRCGEIRISLEDIGEESLMEQAIEAGADDIEADDEDHIVRTSAESLGAVANALREAGLNVISAELVYVPENTVAVTEVSAATKILRLYEALDDYDDTLNVFSNFDISDEIMEQVMAK